MEVVARDFQGICYCFPGISRTIWLLLLGLAGVSCAADSCIYMHILMKGLPKSFWKLLHYSSSPRRFRRTASLFLVPLIDSRRESLGIAFKFGVVRRKFIVSIDIWALHTLALESTYQSGSLGVTQWCRCYVLPIRSTPSSMYFTTRASRKVYVKVEEKKTVIFKFKTTSYYQWDSVVSNL